MATKNEIRLSEKDIDEIKKSKNPRIELLLREFRNEIFSGRSNCGYKPQITQEKSVLSTKVDPVKEEEEEECMEFPFFD